MRVRLLSIWRSVTSSFWFVPGLMSAAAARRWMEQVSNSLTAAMSPELGHVYQDGGMPVHGIARNIDEAHWDEVARRFLLTDGGRNEAA